MNAARKRILKEVRRIKSTTPCSDCKTLYPYYVMHFDHVTGTKQGNINRMVYTSSYQSVLVEISKCDVVCANCHHIRTYTRQAANDNS